MTTTGFTVVVLEWEELGRWVECFLAKVPRPERDLGERTMAKAVISVSKAGHG